MLTKCNLHHYTAGGSAQIAESMAGLIESGGGWVLCNARVEGVVVDPASGSATGVRLKGGAEVAAPVVVSACGGGAAQLLNHQPSWLLI